MIVNRGTPSSTGGAKCISLLKEISMSQLGASADDRANAQFSVMWAWSGPIGRVGGRHDTDQQVVLQVVADGEVDDGSMSWSRRCCAGPMPDTIKSRGDS